MYPPDWQADEQQADLPPPDEATLPAGSEPAQAMPRFCPACGAAWQPEWTCCQACVARSAHQEQAARERTAPSQPVKSALALYFMMLLVSIVTVAALTHGSDEPSSEAQVHAIFIDDAISTAIVLLWCVASWPVILSGLRTTAGAAWYLVAGGFSLATFALASVVVTLAAGLLGAEELSYSAPFLEAGFGWGTIVVSICVQPAIIEELAFRGVILAALERVLGVRDAVIVSALMFMVIHLTVLSFPHLFLIGLALGYLRVRTGSLYPCILAHFLHNLFVLLSEAFWE